MGAFNKKEYLNIEKFKDFPKLCHPPELCHSFHDAICCTDHGLRAAPNGVTKQSKMMSCTPVAQSDIIRRKLHELLDSVLSWEVQLRSQQMVRSLARGDFFLIVGELAVCLPDHVTDTIKSRAGCMR